jgi:geranylgeranyl pyrophosphate synthase
MSQLPLPAALQHDLRQVEQIVQERTRARAAVIALAASSRDAVGGDTARLRPDSEYLRASLVLLAATAGSYRSEQVLHAAAAAELIFGATRTHDALVDEGERRRGEPRSGEWDHGVSLMVGDYLFALAAGEMSLTPDPRVIAFYSQAVMRFTESTLAPPPPLRPLEQARARYLERVDGTVGALLAASCMAGGTCAGLAAERIEALGRFGANLGLALRVADEIYYAAREENAELFGVTTLPLIYAAHTGDGQRLQTALDSHDPVEHRWALSEVAAHGVGPARKELASLLELARAELRALPQADIEALLAIMDYVDSQLLAA